VFSQNRPQHTGEHTENFFTVYINTGRRLGVQISDTDGVTTLVTFTAKVN
jgi:hypothetical protein